MPFHRWFRPGKPDGNLMDRQTFATGDVPARVFQHGDTAHL